MAELRIYAEPSNLFRYRSLGDSAEQEIDALRGQYIFCPAYSAMNDPMEGMHRISTRFAGRSSSAKSQARVLEALDTVGIASMSEVHDHEPMWAHYAGQFGGMCVQYSLNQLIRGLDRDVAITRMMYSEREPVLLDDKSIAMDRARLSLSSKTLRWSSEREWRIFRPTVGEARYGDGRVVTKIYLGSRISGPDEALVREVGATLRVPVAKMEIDAYSMSFKSLRRARQPAR